jgi:signal transduction histidine kinase
MDQVLDKISNDFVKALQKNAQQIMKVAQETQEKVRSSLKDWGCDADCVD